MLDVRIDSKVVAARGGERILLLEDVAFTVGPGEIVAILAPSGTGKSTALRILLGLDPAFAGHARRATDRVGVMFQEPRLLPWLTVADNLRLAVPRTAPQPDIAALLADVQLSHAASLYPRQLSLGMARRAALARALAVSPALLVLDEPFASLDPLLAADLSLVVARQARERGAAVMLATHDLGQALGFASRLLILAGRPARLAADLAVPGGDGPGARAALQAAIMSEFRFLDPGPRQG